ncbi:glycosyltransferase family 39 protein [Geminocystis sp. GBBB08]|uniref:glycosyltransferase family 39 protein n=1 Tax=Geminocystis sp. GBBB08 TaxID=2604140 RepID=UPI0027E24307|nr:glycosyltransferase family 39 protein [Geminocystis sp. GBBB08]MBL1211165.1 phospholipid carrier-dependent glycosyltransferase [Geminocystis sp. GBBB08]
MLLKKMLKNSTSSSDTLSNKFIILSLFFIWGFGLIVDRIWFSLDHRIPSWDPSEYLNGVMVYKEALKTPHFFDASWWREFWLLSNKIPPLMYIFTAPFFLTLGASVDHGNLVLSLFSLILLISISYLGILFFNAKIALFAWSLIQLIPALYYYRLEFLLDYPLTSIVTFSFTCFSYWYFTKTKFSWWLAILSGISFGLGIMLKQTFAFFLFLPICFAFISLFIYKKWDKLTQLITSFIIATLIFFPWYRTNWLLIFTSGKRATIDSAILEGDPPLNTLQAWTFYGKVLPYLLSWHLFIIPLICLIYLAIKYLTNKSAKPNKISAFIQHNFYQNQLNVKNGNYSLTSLISIWLAMFLVGGYLLSSLNINKDARYILPLLPVLVLIISALIYSYQAVGSKFLKLFTLLLALILMLFNLFPLGGDFLTNKLSPKMQNFPYMSTKWATPEVISTAINITPYLKSNIGVLPSTPEINQHNISFFGSIPSFKVFGRQVGVQEKFVLRDVNSLDWFLTKTGYQGSIPDAQKTTVELVENNGDFGLVKQWSLPDESELKLYHRLLPYNEVIPLNTSNSNIKLEEVIVPENVKQGQSIPFTYKWSGSWDNLENAIVILNWQSLENEKKWTHDHRIAMGNLHSGNLTVGKFNQDFQVVENTVMFVDENLPDGDYILQATYLNIDTGESYPIFSPNLKITLNKNADLISSNRELDLVSQIGKLAPNLSQGIKGLDPIFSNIGRINQYDPTQDYLKVTEKVMQYRLQTEDNLDYLYTLLLSQVLQQKVNEAIATAHKLVEKNPENAFNHGYLTFLYLYDWRGKEGEKALQPALTLKPEMIEFQYLKGISALMQGNFFKAWDIYQQISKNN